MTAQMTPWYPPEIKPVRAGWYQEGYEIAPKSIHPYNNAAWWNGSAWCEGDAAQPSWLQLRHWRGLAADPEVTK
jgi:hypothetical protein